MSVRSLMVVSLAVAAFVVLGDTVTWNMNDNGVSYYWDDASKWTCSNGTTHRVPTKDDIVVIPNRTSYPYGNHNIIVTNALPKFKSVFIGSRRTVVMRGWNNKIECGDLILKGESNNNNSYFNAGISCTGGFSDSAQPNRVWIVADNLIMSNAYTHIDVSGGGYGVKNGPCWKEAAPAAGNAGASHGGYGSDKKGKIYGSLTEPTDPGSGAWNAYQGVGGGAVRIQVKKAIVRGNIYANGTVSYYGWGCGSGGSIYLSCQTIEGGGTIAANGGGLDSAGNIAGGMAGGGGRISINYDPVLQDAVDCEATFSARGGLDIGSAGNVRHQSVGYCGTVYFTDDRFLHRPGRRVAGKVYYGDGPTHENSIVGDTLTFTNTLFELEEGCVVDVTNDLTFVGTATRGNGIRVTSKDPDIKIGGNLNLVSARVAMHDGGKLSVGGDLIFADNAAPTKCGEVFVKASPTNGVDGANGATLDIVGDWYMGKNAGYYPECDPTNGSVVYASCRNFIMATNAQIIADAKGFRSTMGPGNDGVHWHGAAHGGKGGGGNVCTYGNPKAPILPGSGGGTNREYTGRYGGGVIWVEAYDQITLGGTISVNATHASVGTYGHGAGSGGSIYFSCRGRLNGEATLTANGGNNIDGSGYPGGGGRIALAGGTVESSKMTLKAAGGRWLNETERSEKWGEDGTIYIKQAGGFLLIIK